MNDEGEGEGEVEWYIELAESIPIPVYVVLVSLTPLFPALPTYAVEHEHRPDRPRIGCAAHTSELVAWCTCVHGAVPTTNNSVDGTDCS